MLHRVMVHIALLVALVCLATAPARAQQKAATPVDEVRAAETAFAKSMADRNIGAFTALLADDAVFFGGNNGWTGPHEKEHAHNHLARHVDSGRLAPEQAASYVMAKGVSDRGAKCLRLLLEKVG